MPHESALTHHGLRKTLFAAVFDQDDKNRGLRQLAGPGMKG